MLLPDSLLARAADTARGLAIDAISACNSGHLGLPLGAAELGAVLFGDTLRLDPADPRWINRDRFVLSAGHGSMFLYAWLHLAGFDLSLDDLKAFRRLGSRTPGHPEFGETAGVECTTGPLGQGIGNAVGMALAARWLKARHAEAPLDYKVFCLAGDGCMQEGVAMEACAFAAHQGLDDLVLLFDSNRVTLDAPASATQSEDTEARFRAIGFDVCRVDGHDVAALRDTLARVRQARTGRPWLVLVDTEIARGIPQVAGTAKGHGEGGTAFAAEARAGLGLPAETFHVDPQVARAFANLKEKRGTDREIWNARWEAFADEHAAAAELLRDPAPGDEDLLASISTLATGKPQATRAAAGKALSALATRLPHLLSGSADLHGSTKNLIEDGGFLERETPSGRNIRFGIREHAMGAILNGMAYDGHLLASGATFMVFADYLRPSIRLAALAGLPVVYFLTHDSVGVGEDGPTHQPVETVSGLRLIPGLDVIRPADAEESAGAVAAAFMRREGPTVLSLSRQNLPDLEPAPASLRRRGPTHGAYVIRPESAELELILLASGSEVQLALAAAERLGPAVRVVSMPSMERFRREGGGYRKDVLPTGCWRRIAIEAGVGALWREWVGERGRVLGIERFGLSAPGDVAMRELGIHVDALEKEARELLKEEA